MSLSVHSSAGSVARFVYLFGDMHVRKPSCAAAAPSPDKDARSDAKIDDVVDVFLEHDYYGKYRSMYDARLAQADLQTANGDVSFLLDVAAVFARTLRVAATLAVAASVAADAVCPPLRRPSSCRAHRFQTEASANRDLIYFKGFRARLGALGVATAHIHTHTRER